MHLGLELFVPGVQVGHLVIAGVVLAIAVLSLGQSGTEGGN